MKLSAVKHPFAILAMLLLAWTQCVGAGTGFLCFCTGQPVQTLMDHCDGPHGAGCMEFHMPHTHHLDGHGAHDNSNTERHISVKKEIKLPAAGKTVTAPVYMAVIVAVLPLVTLTSPEPGVFHLCDISRPPPEWSSVGVSLPHTVALLI